MTSDLVLIFEMYIKIKIKTNDFIVRGTRFAQAIFNGKYHCTGITSSTVYNLCSTAT